MFSNYIHRFLFWILIFRIVPTYAQDTTASQVKLPEKWDLQACLDYAKINNITLNSYRLNRLSSQQDLELSKAAVLPNLSASASPSLIQSKTIDPVTGDLKSGVRFSGSSSLNSSVILYNGGYLKTDIQQKDLLVKIAGLDVATVENDITLQITQAYLNILLAKENIVYVRDVVATSSAQVQQQQQFYDVGAVALKDLVQLQAQLANDKYTLVTAENTHRQNLLVLKQLLQLPTVTPFEIVEPDTLMGNALLTPLLDAQQTALDTRPEVKSSELGVQVATLDVRKARAGYLPALTAGAGLGTSYAHNDNYSFLRQLDNNFYQQVGLTLSVPIFSRRANRVNEEKAKIGVGQAELTLQNTRTNLSQEVERAYINVQNAQGQYDAAVEQLRYTQEAYRIANEQLKIGAANTVEVLQQKNLYVQSMQSYIQAKYAAALYIRIYDFYRGVPVHL
ncbi:outer membrane protein [Chitinophaga sp. YR627]|uniref:TolC family protein n=1 Tax=Chitinophaga sp. YR627 TaxID=1881041 RepID=UPI0008EBB6CB|nr:TolC family protein [Chitinophaga sp. YR627]SFM69010.1 outer membrane protein [Chitinophaga sp. YR627]